VELWNRIYSFFSFSHMKCMPSTGCLEKSESNVCKPGYLFKIVFTSPLGGQTILASHRNSCSVARRAMATHFDKSILQPSITLFPIYVLYTQLLRFCLFATYIFPLYVLRFSKNYRPPVHPNTELVRAIIKFSFLLCCFVSRSYCGM
jgi:hypothetical protein